MRGDVVLKGDDGERVLLRWFFFHLDGAAITRGSAGFEALANIVLRNDRGTRVAEGHVSAGVVPVIVRVDDEAHRLVCNLQFFQRGLDFFSQGSELVVRSEEQTSELQSHLNLVCRLLLVKK